MKFPEKVRIGPLWFDVVMCDRISAPRGDNAYGHRFGEIDFAHLEIRICAVSKASQRWETLLHEVLHGFSSEVPDGLELTEDQIVAISPYLMSFLLDNGFLEIEELTEYEERVREHALEINDDMFTSKYILSTPVKGGSG